MRVCVCALNFQQHTLLRAIHNILDWSLRLHERETISIQRAYVKLKLRK